MKSIKKLLSKRWFAILWTTIIFILLAMPGSVMPNEPTFTIPQLDKFVHVMLFGGFVFLWCFYYTNKGLPDNRLVSIFFYAFVIACVYGIGMEYVQKYFIPMRDFDEADIIADIIGASLSYGICNIRLLKITSG